MTMAQGRFSPEFADFLSCCLQKDPQRRSTCNELLLHPFLKRALPEVRACHPDTQTAYHNRLG